MVSSRGNIIPNQFTIDDGDRILFQSYKSIIAIKYPYTRQVILDNGTWNYSNTTSKYRNIFLGETTKETTAKIKDGTYELSNLN